MKTGQLKGALTQLDNAAILLRNLSEATGNETSKKAARVILQLRNALEFGAAYKVTGPAEEFDFWMEHGI